MGKTLGHRRKNCRESNDQIKGSFALRKNVDVANVSEGTLSSFGDCTGNGEVM